MREKPKHSSEKLPSFSSFWNREARAEAMKPLLRAITVHVNSKSMTDRVYSNARTWSMWKRSPDQPPTPPRFLLHIAIASTKRDLQVSSSGDEETTRSNHDLSRFSCCSPLHWEKKQSRPAFPTEQENVCRGKMKQGFKLRREMTQSQTRGPHYMYIYIHIYTPTKVECGQVTQPVRRSGLRLVKVFLAKVM